MYLGSLAQLVQSICLTSRGSGVRTPQLPRGQKRFNAAFVVYMAEDKKFHFYILYSPKRNRYYIGYTGELLEERLRKHNSDHNGYTGGVGDWSIRYTEVFASKSMAYSREREVKSWRSRTRVEELIRGG